MNYTKLFKIYIRTNKSCMFLKYQDKWNQRMKGKEQIKGYFLSYSVNAVFNYLGIENIFRMLSNLIQPGMSCIRIS